MMERTQRQVFDGVMEPISMRRPLTERDLRLMQLPERLWGASLGKVPGEGVPESPNTIIRKYLKILRDMMSEGIGLLIHGEGRGGKSSAAAVVAKEARRQGKTVLFIESSNLVDSILDRTEWDSTQTMKERAKTVDLLVLDDFGKEFRDKAGLAEKVLESILRARAQAMRPTIMTTNIPPSVLMGSGRESSVSLIMETMIVFQMEGGRFFEENVEAVQGKLK
jgi:DNA replication protein DnaC